MIRDTAGQNDVKIGRAAAAVTGGDGREFTTDFVLTAVRQYEELTAAGYDVLFWWELFIEGGNPLLTDDSDGLL
ncbi:hypothetical protein [Natrinema limicola]|uniref:Uncharacterized protein n=1 Tax=Natrinema limicola JCM 13563 TaxID=1230457 RepID=M0C477_9EURY|nr:hypothetical protein [Natrinema limicola]ELZ17127.1 hypothetical protein C476_16360 [Natrinema limicola JCM 13563]